MRTRSAIAVVGLLLVVAVVIRCAWVSDDAYISLRVADNFLSGHGLRWNVIERVQAYTHPLWLGGLTLVYALIGDAWTSAWLLGSLTTALAVGGLLARARPAGALLAIAALISSKALVDYGTSGLENPLTHLGLVALAFSADRRSLVGATLAGSALTLTRPDAALLAIPCIGALARAEGRAAWRSLLLGMTPVLLWEAFSLVYYGALVPNTALAKLGHGVPRHEVVEQGVRYALHLLWHDPLTAALVVTGPLLALWGRDRTTASLAAGSLAYSAYVVWVGGDFMAGRFWTAPAFIGLLAIARQDMQLRRAGPAATVVVALGLVPAGAPLRADRHYQRLPAWNGIVDERGYYHAASGLFGPNPDAEHPDHAWVDDGRRVRAAGGPSPTARACVGYFGFFAGPGIHVLDRLALADPLLARLPAEYDPSWRIGHFRRGIPTGYDPLDPRLSDPELDALYSDVIRVTQAPLFEPARWGAIARLLFARAWVNPSPYRFHGLRKGVVSSPTTPPTRGLTVAAGPGRTLVVDRGRGDGVHVIAARGLQPIATWDVPGTRAGARFQTWTAPWPSGADQVMVFPLSQKSTTRVRKIEVLP